MFLKSIFMLLVFLIGIVLLLVLIRKITWLPNPYPTPKIAAKDMPQFKDVPVNFTHSFPKKSLPFMGAAIFEMNGEQCIFVGGGYDQPDALFAFRNGQFVDVSAQAGISKDAQDTTYGAVAVDANNDGQVDLFIARHSGVYLFTNNNGSFSGTKLDIPLDPKDAPLSIAVADLQNKGTADLFVCTYLKPEFVEGQTIFNKEGYGAKSLLLKNNGDNTFTDITKQAGLEYVHNTFQAVFVDLDNRGKLDLVVAYDTGMARIYKNMGDMKFALQPHPLSDSYGYPMGIAVGDYSGNGKPDLFFTNVGRMKWYNLGANPPTFIVRGDLRKDQTFVQKQILLRNDGNFNFTDVSDQSLVADYEFGWGCLFQDFSNKGYPDLAFAQNYILFPPHKFLLLPCRLLQQQSNGTFASIEKQSGASNPDYAISPLYADFNNNGYADLVYTNLNGKLRVLLNQGVNNNNFVKVVLKNEPQSVGARVAVTLAGGKTITQFFVPTQGLCTSQTNQLIIGIGKANAIERVVIKYVHGAEKVLDNVAINSTLRV